MVEITVKAADSASAMEEIEKRLGSDALIISTNKVDGKIEIVASNEELSKYQKSQKPLVLDNSYRVRKFSEVLDEKTSTESPSKIKDQQDVNYHEIQASLETRVTTHASSTQSAQRQIDTATADTHPRSRSGSKCRVDSDSESRSRSQRPNKASLSRSHR